MNRRLIMKLLVSFLVCACAWLCNPGNLEAEEALDPKVREEVYKLAVQGITLSDALKLDELLKHPDPEHVQKELDRLNPVFRKKAREELQRRPGLKPYLYEMFNEYNRLQDPWTESILEAFAARDDLTHEDIEKIKPEAIRILNEPRTYHVFPQAYLKGALSVIARELTPENEEILFKALARSKDSDINLKAAKILADKGVVKALPLMEQAVERNKEEGAMDIVIGLMENEVSRMKAKVDAASKVGEPESRSFNTVDKNAPAPPKPQLGANTADKTDAYLWLAAFLLAIGLTWVILRKIWR